ncbi:MAG: c-type cytochrome [Polyangia bacterium]
MTTRRRGALNIVAAATLIAAGAGCRPPSPQARPAFTESLTLGGRAVGPEQLNRGADAYVHYCRACHGDAGDGAGASARGLQPPPRDLRLGVYKFAAVAAGQLPNDTDFRRTISGGLHGTAMLAWDVPPVQLDDLIQYIKTFSPRWRQEKPGEPIVLSHDPWQGREQAAIDRGSRVYHGLAQCAVACHPAYLPRGEIFEATKDLTGMRLEAFRGDLYAAVRKPSDYGVEILPTDFTFNPLRAGDSTADIARTIAAGIGGTAMPTWKNVLPDIELWAMAHYVRSLVMLRNTPASDALRERLATQPAWTPPPLPTPDADGGAADGPAPDAGRSAERPRRR